MSIQTLAAETDSMTTVVASLLLNEDDAACLAKAYAAKNIDPAFQVVNGARYYNKVLGRAIWRFYVCSPHGPICLLQIDAYSGKVIALSAKEIQQCRRDRPLLLRVNKMYCRKMKTDLRWANTLDVAPLPT